MERLTEKRDGKVVIPLRNSVCGVDMSHWCISKESDIQSFLSGDAADRLAAYEDTGLEPEEIVSLAKGNLKNATVDVGTKLYDLVVSNVFEKRYGVTLSRMCELAEADKDGKRCCNCSHLKVINRTDLYAKCEETGALFLPFRADTRESYCSLHKPNESAEAALEERK